MAGKIIFSTAYLPPVEYFSEISGFNEIVIEKQENFLKQSYRNRCYILSSHGPQLLTVPVYLGSLHKTPVKDIRIDYSKRWQQVHLRAMTASYNSSPYFEFYFERIARIINENHTYLIDLNSALSETIFQFLKIDCKINYSESFEPVTNSHFDFRYRISPKKTSQFTAKKYIQVFETGIGFISNLSIVDLIYNTGPEANRYLRVEKK